MTSHDPAQDLLAAVPLTPDSEDAPVFAEPWQAEAFAMALALHARGVFTWKEWADRLASAISDARRSGDPDTGDTYYHHWLTALEGLVVAKGLLDRDAMIARHAAWDRAAHATPHGQPIVLGPEPA